MSEKLNNQTTDIFGIGSPETVSKVGQQIETGVNSLEKLITDKEGNVYAPIQYLRKFGEDVFLGGQKNPNLSEKFYNKLGDKYIDEMKQIKDKGSTNTFIDEVNNHIQQYGDFNYITDFFLPINDVEKTYSDPNLKLMRDNNIDPWEFINEPQVYGTGMVDFDPKQPNFEDTKKNYSSGVLNFIKSIPEELLLTTAETILNLGNNAVQLAGMGSNLIFGGTENQGFANDTTRIAQSVNDKTTELVGKLNEFRKNNDINSFAHTLTDLGVEIGVAAPIEKMLSKFVPKYVSIPLSFGISYAITGNPEEDRKHSFFIDSQVVNRVNEVLGVLPDTPEAQVSNLVANAFEGTIWGAIGERLVKVFQFLKKTYPAFMNKAVPSMPQMPPNLTNINQWVMENPKTMFTSIFAGSIYRAFNKRIDEIKALPLEEQQAMDERNNKFIEDKFGITPEQFDQLTFNEKLPIFWEMFKEAQRYKLDYNKELFGNAYDKAIGTYEDFKNSINNYLKEKNIPVENQNLPPDNLVASSMNIMSDANVGSEKKSLMQSQDNLPPDNLVAGIGDKFIAPVFKSFLKEAAQKIPNKGTGTQILGQLRNIQGIKEAEIKWSGLDDFLKNKKSVTKEEIASHLQNNALDVHEVKFTGKTEIPSDLQSKIDKFKNKWSDLSTKEITDKVPVSQWQYENLNFDQYRVAFGSEKGGMDFNTLRSVLGEKPSLDKMAKLDNGNLITKDDVTKNMSLFGADADRMKTFQISPIEFEKYMLENERRLYAQKYPKPKFEHIAEAGGSDYTELAFTIKKGGMDIGIPSEITKGENITKTFTPYKNPSHLNVNSEIAHVRFKTREMNGKKILAVEEMQSDFGISAKKYNDRNFEKSYNETMTNTHTVGHPNTNLTDEQLIKQAKDNATLISDFPFKNNWYELVIKRLARYGADNGFDAIAIPKGSVSAKRYNYKGEYAKEISIETYEYGTSKPDFRVSFLNKDGKELSAKELIGPNEIGTYLDKYKVSPEIKSEISTLINKKEADKNLKEYLNGPKVQKYIVPMNTKEFIGQGEGKYKLYDETIPSYLKKFAKKWNAKVYDLSLENSFDIGSGRPFRVRDIPVTILELTPEMKKSVQENSQTLFNIFGLGGSGVALGSKAIQDNIQNNTISNQTNN